MKRSEIKLNTPYRMSDGSIMFVLAHGLSDGIDYVVACGHSINPKKLPEGYKWKHWYPVTAVVCEATYIDLEETRQEWSKLPGTSDGCALNNCWCTTWQMPLTGMDIYDLQAHMGWTDDTLLKLYNEFFEEHYSEEITEWLRNRAKEELRG